MDDLTLALVIKLMESTYEAVPYFYVDDDASFGYEFTPDHKHFCTLLVYEEGFMTLRVQTFTAEGYEKLNQVSPSLTTLKQLKQEIIKYA